MKPISNSFLPNFQKDDLYLSFKLILKPWIWKQGDFLAQLQNQFKKLFNLNYAFPFNSGRSAFFAILKAIELKEGEEIFVQCFTCNALLNPILASGGKIIFVDIDNSLNLDPDNLEKKIKEAKKPKAVVIQHTFGFPAQIERIKKLAEKFNLILIEDCAHSLGGKYKNTPLGNFGDLSFFSFGRDKIISSVYGGIAATNNETFAKKIKNFQEKISFPSNFWIFQNLVYLSIFYLSLPIFDFFKIGKTILFLARKIGLINPAVYPSENYGKLHKTFPKKLPNALANLALNQLKKIGQFNTHRAKLASLYIEKLKNFPKISLVFKEWPKDIEPVFMRFPILVKNRKKIIESLKKEGIYLEDGWSESVIVPKKTKIKNFGYQQGMCPKAEKIVNQIINLPTNINTSQKEAKKIVNLIQNLTD